MIKNRCDNLDSHWQKLPPGKQRKWIICFFAGYLLLTAGVILTIWHDARTGKHHPAAHHIRNPILEKSGNGVPVKDSLILNNKGYEIKKNKGYERN